MTPSPSAEDALARAARRARERGVLTVPLPPSVDEPATDGAPAAPAFDDEVMLWALASSSCGGLDACLGPEAP